MSETTVSRRVMVPNPQGFHFRPADLFVRLAARFKSDIDVVKGEKRVGGKGIWDLLTLDAPQGTELVIEAKGEDAEAAVEALAGLVAAGFPDPEADAPPQLPGYVPPAT
jgi:phosphotransferase system HPr (HPr) family protein